MASKKVAGIPKVVVYALGGVAILGAVYVVHRKKTQGAMRARAWRRVALQSRRIR